MSRRRVSEKVLPQTTDADHREIRLFGLLKTVGFDFSIPTKLVRHVPEADELRRVGLFDDYQAIQSRSVFDGCQQILSFVATSSTHARLLGVYRVGERRENRDRPRLPDPRYERFFRNVTYRYVMEKLSGFGALEGRVIIDWGSGTRSWVQQLQDRRIVEILPGAEAVPVFDDYLDFSLTHDELVRIFAAPEAHREWRSRLRAVAGVYLVLATTDGAQYIGSACGDEGLWGRWAGYAVSGHGGNHLLRGRVEAEPVAYPSGFRYSILQVLPKSLARSAVLGWEARFKQKLGTRATGLNLN